jgi:hypothetical protein
LQIIITIFWVFIFIIKFFIKYILRFFKKLNIKPLLYEEVFKYVGNNITLLALINILIDIPKKTAFMYLYRYLYVFFMVENKKSILRIFKDYKLFLKIFNKFFIKYLVRIITTYPYIVLKNNNKITNIFINL